jgi:hypothetical protein
MKVCINCYAENALDAVFCSGCGMSLMGAHCAEEAPTPRGERREETRIPRADHRALRLARNAISLGREPNLGHGARSTVDCAPYETLQGRNN